MDFVIKCRKCRTQLTTGCGNVVDAHKQSVSKNATMTEKVVIECSSLVEKNKIFLNEDLLPDWISKEIDESQWTKGKLKCLGCDSRIGSFDFVSAIPCSCSQNVLPPVHLVNSKVDLPISINNM